MDMPTRSDAAANLMVKIPIAIGVVGHSDPALDAERELAASVRDILERIHFRYKHSPIEVVSRLTRGSDQIAADVAIKKKWSVRVPLPFPADVYAASDSSHPGVAQDRLADLLRDPLVSSFVVPLTDGPQPADTAAWKRLLDDPTEGARCYARSDWYIARHCVVLIALWDGEGGDPSGPEPLIRLMLEGTAPSHDHLRLSFHWGSDTGPVAQVYTPRMGLTYRAKPMPGTVHILVPPAGDAIPRKLWERPPGTWRWFVRRVFGTLGVRLGNKSHNEFWKSREMLRSIDEFNRDVASANQTTIEAIKEATQRLLHSKESEKPDQWVHLGQIKEFERLAQVRAAASELAKTLDRRLKWSLRMLLFGLFLALACFHFYAHHIVEGAPHPTHRPIFLGLFLLVLLVLAGLVAVVWYWRGDDRRLDYRALAEALRVRYFWGLAGLTRSVAGTYMGQLEGEMSWARRALYAVSPHPHEWQRIYESRMHPTRKSA